MYEHFGGKEGLHAVIVDREVQEPASRLHAALDADHPRAALEQVTEAFLAYIEEEQAGFRVLVKDAPVGSRGGSLPSVLADVATSVEALLVRELEVARLRPQDGAGAGAGARRHGRAHRTVVAGHAVLGSTALGAVLGLVHWTPQWYDWRGMTATAFQLDIPGALRIGAIEIIFVFLFVDLFDNIGTLVGVGMKAGLFNKANEIPRVNRICSPMRPPRSPALWPEHPP